MDATVWRLAHYVHDLTFSGIAKVAIHEARRRIIDSVACAAAASQEPFCHNLKALAARSSSNPCSRLWGGTGPTTSVEMAAFVNGTMLRYLDFSDTVLSRSNGHPSDMLGGLIAVAEAYRCDGPSLLTAVVAAYEVYCSLCASVPMASHGIDQGTAAAVGTAAGVASLLNLSLEQTSNSLSLALAANVHLYNVRCGELSDWKGCGGPNGARNGVFAAMLAREGVTGPTAPVEGKGGLYEVLGRFDWVIGATDVPLIAQTHLKFHPVCYHGQAAIDAAITLRQQVAVHDIQNIEIETYEASYLAMGRDPTKWAPTNRETADHSLPYTVISAWTDGKLLPSSYVDSRLQCPATRALMSLVSVTPMPALTAEFPNNASTRIRVLSKDGREFEHLQRNPKGNAGNPLSDTELETKFVDLFGAWGDPVRARHVLDVLWSVDSLTDVSSLVNQLCNEQR